MLRVLHKLTDCFRACVHQIRFCAGSICFEVFSLSKALWKHEVVGAVVQKNAFDGYRPLHHQHNVV